MNSMQTTNPLTFEDTSVAFTAKSDKELRKTHLMFSVINEPWMSSLSMWLTKWGLKFHLPIRGLVKKTIFELFCGGETIDACDATVKKLYNHNVKAILDYSVEGEDSEEDFESTKDEILRTIEKAAGNDAVPFSVFKPTGISDTDVLEKVSLGKELTEKEQNIYKNIERRFDEICSLAHKHNVKVLIDAEDTYTIGAVDELAYQMMEKYNKESCLIFNTFQMYRHRAYKDLKEAFHRAAMNQNYLGAKLVRGAYMEKERTRAEEMGYEDPIQATKEDTDQDFNKALRFCIDNKQRVSVLCGSHNEYSNKLLTVLMDKHSMKRNDERVWFAQLYGMGDNISFNLADAGYNVVKYIPYGPIRAVLPYLIRRAKENTSVAGQSSRELQMVRKEIERREKAKN